MSTYDSAVYRDNAFQKLARHIGHGPDASLILAQTLDWNVEPYGQYPVPKGVLPGNLKAQVLAGLVKTEDLYDGPPVRVQKGLIKRLPTNVPYHTGLKAVYNLYSRWFSQGSELDRTPDDTLIEEIFYTGMVLGQHTPRDAATKKLAYNRLWRSKCSHYKGRADDLLRLACSYQEKKYALAVREARLQMEEYPTVMTPEAKRLFRGNVIVMQGLVLAWDNFQVWVLTREDCDRLERMLKGTANAIFYMSTYGQMSADEHVKLNSCVNRYFSAMVELMKVATFDQCQYLCRGLDVAYYIALAKYSSDIDVVSLNKQLDKAKKPELASFMDCVRIANIVQDLPIKDGLEVMLLYKVLPSADFDYFGAAERQRVEYTKQHVIQDVELFNYILRWHKKLMIIAYHARHNICPGHVTNPDPEVAWQIKYPAINPNLITLDKVRDIVITGQFSYADHTLDVFDMVKDKAICPKGVASYADESAIRKLKRQQKNQLLDVVTRPAPISMVSLRSDLDSLYWDIKTEDKAEAKKPNGRWFMENHTDVRLVMSEYELSIANYGKYLEGYVLGKGIRDKQMTMNHVTEATGGDADTVQTFWSIDVDKWSPHMPIEVQDSLNAQWSDAFGMPHIAGLGRLFEKGDLHYIKRRIHHVMPKTGNDYEGLSGKKLTMYHLAVMHSAADILRRKGLIVGNARFAVLVDDGVLRFMVRKDQVQEITAKIRKEITLIWKAAGIELSWDKTLVSMEFAIFLNEIRYANRALNCGIRAIVKMTNYVETAAPNITEELQKCESTARGAIVAGSILTVAYYLHAMLVVDTLRKWAGKDYVFNNRTVHWAFAPIGLGGAGVSNALVLVGSLDFDSFQGGLSNLFMTSHRWPDRAKLANKIMNQEMRTITGSTQATNPTAIRRKDPIFRVDRLRRSLELAMATYLKGPVVSAYNISEGSLLSSQILAAATNEHLFPVELRDLLYASTIGAFIEQLVTKVLKSGTAMAILPRRVIFRVAISNVTEARQVFKSW